MADRVAIMNYDGHHDAIPCWLYMDRPQACGTYLALVFRFQACISHMFPIPRMFEKKTTKRELPGNRINCNGALCTANLGWRVYSSRPCCGMHNVLRYASVHALQFPRTSKNCIPYRKCYTIATLNALYYSNGISMALCCFHAFPCYPNHKKFVFLTRIPNVFFSPCIPSRFGIIMYSDLSDMPECI